MKAWVVVMTMAVTALAGCTDDAGTDSEGAQSVLADAESSNADVLEALLQASVVEGNATLPVTLSFDVETDLDAVEWELTMTPEDGGTVLHMGQGGREDLPGSRAINLTEGTYTAAFSATAGNESSEAALTIIVHPGEGEAEEDPCQDDDYSFYGGVNDDGAYVTADNQVWQESNGQEGLQTPDSCPDGPHDTRLV